MYRALALVCLIVVSQAGAPANTQNLQFGSDDFLNFVKGFLAGIGSDLQLQEIVTCYDDVSSGVEYALEAEKYCKEEGIWNKTKCLYYKAEALKELPGAILSCKSAFTTDAKTIATAISEVENPISVVYHVGKEFIFNGGEIYSEFSSACKDWQSGDYYNSGVEFGKVFGIIFVTDGSSLAAVNGFLKGTETSIRLNEIYECLEYLELTKQFMVKGMEILMQSETEEDVLASLGFINGYYSMIYESAKNCNSDESELSKLAAQMKLAADKTSQSFNNGRVFIRGNDVTV